jgi:hypothetical protein
MTGFDAASLWATRRAFLGRLSAGLGCAALSALLGPRVAGASGAATPPGGVAAPHQPPRARRVIYLYMAGGPSHLETFDDKPVLARMHGQPIPPSVTRGQEFSPRNRASDVCVGPQFPFRRCGRSGQSISSLFPHLAGVADELCIVRSVKTDSFVHDIANTFMSTGSLIPGRPCLGSWLWYGLGSESADLPGYVVLRSQGRYVNHLISRDLWGNGFLPTRYQGVELRARGDPVLYLGNPPG